MKTTLRSLFKIYGEVLDVVAHQNYRMRGQAFVSFADKEKAAKALKEVKGFPLYGKPMVRPRIFLLAEAWWLGERDGRVSLPGVA
jgi:RNA recognition motif-containing protein